MIRINLLGIEPTKPKRKRPELTVGGSESVTFLMAIGVTLALIAGAWWLQSNRLSRFQTELAEVEAERAELADIAAQVQDIEDRTESVDQKLDVIVALKRNQSGPLLMLDQISRLMPDGLWLTSLDAQQGAMVIRGSALSNVAVSDFVRNLRFSPYFDDEDLEFTEDTGDAHRFQLNVRFSALYSGTPGGAGEGDSTSPGSSAR